MQIDKSQFLSTYQVQNEYLNQTNKSGNKVVTGMSFQEILNQKTSETQSAKEVKFSKHATSRLEDRNITLTENQLERLNEGTNKASEKGINESLVLVDDLAFIVNIKNSTVITAMDQKETNENIFTNIDGAVII